MEPYDRGFHILYFLFWAVLTCIGYTREHSFAVLRSRLLKRLLGIQFPFISSSSRIFVSYSF